MNTNPLMLLVLTYIAFFGVPINISNPVAEPALNKCEAIPAPVVQPALSLPVIDKVNLENKDYVIRTLINHIREQNEHNAVANKEVNKVYNAYLDCVVR